MRIPIINLRSRSDIGKHFSTTFDKNFTIGKQLKLDLIKTVAKLPDANFAKEKTSISNTISLSVHDALNNAEFVTLKMIPHCYANGSADLAQRFVSCLLFSVSEMISLSAPSANFLDENGSFASTLLKSTKRLYGIIAKLILSFMSNPRSLASEETKFFLNYLTATLMPRISALLLTLQEKQEMAGGKVCNVELIMIMNLCSINNDFLESSLRRVRSKVMAGHQLFLCLRRKNWIMHC